MFLKPYAVVLVASALAAGVAIGIAAMRSSEVQLPAQAPAVVALAPLDKFAGKTVKNVAMGLEVMRQRELNCPQVGDYAPDFELLQKDGESTLRLSDMRGARPVVLIFGSYT